MMIIAILI